jgi:hypothetical protein
VRTPAASIESLPDIRRLVPLRVNALIRVLVNARATVAFPQRFVTNPSAPLLFLIGGQHLAGVSLDHQIIVAREDAQNGEH